MAQQHGRCYYCGCELILGYRDVSNTEIDHIKPLSKYKDGTRGNLCLSCYDCNRKKADLELIQFKQLVLNKYPYKLIRGMFYFEFIGL